MKELFYRRETAGGYKVVAKDASLSAKEEAFCAQKALPVSAGEVPLFTFKQCCMDTGALLVSCGYIDPHGNRGSGMAHALMTQSDEERKALLDAYPATSTYFDDIRKLYSRRVDSLDLETKNLSVPLQKYLGTKSGEQSDALRLLQETFASEDLLAKVFSALLDAASPNPRMVVIALENDSIEELPEHGRSIAEALFCCLPEVVATRLGYLSPAINLSDVSFALRFVQDPSVAKSSMVYLVQPSQNRFIPPSSQRMSVGDYPLMLASKVMDGSPTAFSWIRDIRRVLSDWTIFSSKDISRDIGLRYAFYTRIDSLEPREKRSILEWRHEMVNKAEREGSSVLEASPFWLDVEKWLENNCIPEIWDHQSEWRKGSVLYDPEIVRTLFIDAERLGLLGFGEAGFYRELFNKKLLNGTICPEAEKSRINSELVNYFCDQAGRATQANFSDGLLYWDTIEKWIYAQWVDGVFINNNKVNPAVRKLFQIAPERMRRFLNAYVDHLAQKKVPLCGSDHSDFHEKATEQLLSAQRPCFIEIMKRDLDANNPFASEKAKYVYSWYGKLIARDAELEQLLRQYGEKHLKNTLSGIVGTDAQSILSELNAERTDGILAQAEQLGLREQAKTEMEKCLVVLMREKGFYSFYPQDIQKARQIAKILDSQHAYDRRSWEQRIINLEQIRRLDVTSLTKGHFENYRNLFDHDLDDKDRQKARELLWSQMTEKYKNEKQNDIESLLWALAMKSYENGTINLTQICKDANALGLQNRELKRLLKKYADEEAKEGLGYIAEITLTYLRDDGEGTRDVLKRYPGATTQRTLVRDEEDSDGPFAGIPIGVPIAGSVMFGGGLVVSAISLLRMIGLM